MLQERGLGWVVEDVRAAIRAGRTTPRQEPIQDISTARRLKASTDSLTTISFTAEEELQLLTDAVRRVVVDTGRMEGAVANRFDDEAEEVGIASADLIFVSDDPNQREPVLIIPSNLTPERLAAVERLDQALSDLHDDVSADAP